MGQHVLIFQNKKVLKEIEQKLVPELNDAG